MESIENEIEGIGYEIIAFTTVALPLLLIPTRVEERKLYICRYEHCRNIK